MNQGFYDEVSRRLHNAGFATQFADSEGFLPVEWQGHPLCQVTPSGGVRYDGSKVKDESFEAARNQVYAIAQTAAQIQNLMEAAPPLKAKGLEGDYRLLAEFNGTVLAGQLTRYGVQFITWERDFAKTGLCWGHYHGDNYENAKQDFASRSGLVAEDRLFSAEQLTEVYRTVRETLDSGYPLTTERESLLKGVGEQIKRAVPDLQERVELSNKKELEVEMQYGQTM